MGDVSRQWLLKVQMVRDGVKLVYHITYGLG